MPVVVVLLTGAGSSQRDQNRSSVKKEHQCQQRERHGAQPPTEHQTTKPEKAWTPRREAGDYGPETSIPAPAPLSACKTMPVEGLVCRAV